MSLTLILQIAALVGFLGVLYALRPIYDYRLHGEEVQIVLLKRFPILRIPISDINDIAVVSAWGFPFGFGALRFGNRITKWAVLISRKHALFTRVVITPVEPHAFLADVKLKMRHSSQIAISREH
ncbi:MAG: hypothetical protein A3E01_19335 [Gammaproteobacteria bacterium RIFCSPHIGHO2_12_FULL_63_22]|nr:MAG: hypothetical protein A3E01_19335 [Gammaproteobacteria bacterium RIFCSPHIGHO2_12_FULL_63_22]